MKKSIFPNISVVIPVKNEAKYIAACLEGILSQSVPVFEIIVIDSGSSDGTQKIAFSYPKVNVVDITPEQFNHGDTRNFGAKLAKGEYVLFTVGDAKPVDENWIKHLLFGFYNDKVAGVCGQQVVEHNKSTNPIEWHRPITEKPVMTSYNYACPQEFDSLSSNEKREACGWDDVSAMYRKSILVKIPFKRIVYGEDVYWAIDALRSGYTLTYNPLAKVYHFHNEDYGTTLQRTIAVCYLRYTALGVIPIRLNVPKMFVVRLYQLITKKKLSWKEVIYWIKYNYDLIRAVSSGINYFQNAVFSDGKDGLEILHKKYCGTPPIPLKSIENK